MKVTDAIRRAIKQSGETRYRIAKETGISEAVLSRFANGKSSLAGPSIDVLCKYLGLELRKSGEK